MEFSCKICNFVSNSQFNFNQHKLRHKYSTKENRLFYFCSRCEEGFEKMSTAQKHIMKCLSESKSAGMSERNNSQMG